MNNYITISHGWKVISTPTNHHHHRHHPVYVDPQFVIFTRGQFWPLGIVVACVCVCAVCQSLLCPGDNSVPVQARLTQFAPKVLKTLVDTPIGFWWWLTLTFKSKFNFKIKIYPIRACLRDHPFRLGLPNLNQRWKIPWLRSYCVRSLLCYLHRIYVFQIIVRHAKTDENGVCSATWTAAHIYLPVGSCHGPWNSLVVSFVWPLLASQPVLDSAIGDGFWMLL